VRTERLPATSANKGLDQHSLGFRSIAARIASLLALSNVNSRAAQKGVVEAACESRAALFNGRLIAKLGDLSSFVVGLA
jgi:hypothetical protein